MTDAEQHLEVAKALESYLLGQGFPASAAQAQADTVAARVLEAMRVVGEPTHLFRYDPDEWEEVFRKGLAALRGTR